MSISVTTSPSRHWTPPVFKAPAGACDCHVHIFESNEIFPFASNRLYTPARASIEDLERLMRGLGIERAVIVQPTPYGSDNSCMIDALNHLRSRARGVAVIDAKASDAELALMDEVGVRGARVNLETAGSVDPKLAAQMIEATSSRIAKFGWHLQTYTNLDVISEMKETIEVLPTPLVVDHFGRAWGSKGPGQRGFDVLLDLVSSGKVYVKLSAPYRISEEVGYRDVDAIARELIAANPDRMLWGSDWPHPFAQPGIPRSPDRMEPFRIEDDGLALSLLCRWTEDQGVQRKILVDNPARLYGF